MHWPRLPGRSGAPALRMPSNFTKLPTPSSRGPSCCGDTGAKGDAGVAGATGDVSGSIK
jgi:hypothetical protein